MSASPAQPPAAVRRFGELNIGSRARRPQAFAARKVAANRVRASTIGAALPLKTPPTTVRRI